MIALLCLGHAAHPEVPGEGLYLKSFDFESTHPGAMPGTGVAEFTDDIAEAKLFADLGAVQAFYAFIPEAHPTRPDGRPNRPVTGYHWQLVTVETEGPL